MATNKTKQLGVRIPIGIIKRLDKYVTTFESRKDSAIAYKYKSRAHLVTSILYDWLNEKEGKGAFKQ